MKMPESGVRTVVRQLTLSLLLALGLGAALAQPSGTLNFYTSMQVDVVEDIIAAFEAAYPDVTVDMLYSGSVELEQRIYAERDAGQIRADVIWAANPAIFLKLKAEDLLMAYDSPEAAESRFPKSMSRGPGTKRRGIGYAFG